MLNKYQRPLNFHQFAPAKGENTKKAEISISKKALLSGILLNNIKEQTLSAKIDANRASNKQLNSQLQCNVHKIQITTQVQSEVTKEDFLEQG